MHNPGERDWLDEVLTGSEEYARHEYIHDNGFTESVMRRLPPRPHRGKLHAGILGCALSLAVAVCLLSIPDTASLYADFSDFLYTQSLYNLAGLAVAIYTALTAVTWWVNEPDI
jgi:hypothetical protein